MANSKKNDPDSSGTNPNILDAMLNEAEILMDEELNSIVGENNANNQFLIEDVFDNAENEIADISEQDRLNKIVKSPTNKSPLDLSGDKSETIAKKAFELEQKNDSKSVPETAISALSSTKTNIENNSKADLKIAFDPNTDQLSNKNKPILQSIKNTSENRKKISTTFDKTEFDQTSEEDILSLVKKTNQMKTPENIEEENHQIKDLHYQIHKQGSEIQSIKQEMVFLSSTSDHDATADELGVLQKENYRTKKFIRSLQTDQEKGSFLTYVALGTALLSLLIGGGLGLFGYMAYSDSKELSDQLISLKKQSAFSSSQLSTTVLDKKIRLLTAKNDALSRQVNDLKGNENSDSLNPVIINLQTQNQQNQTTIKQLLTKVKNLEKRQPSSSSSFSASPQTQKKVGKAGFWTVNLVSFKNNQDAQKKVKEFANKGISAEILQIKLNNRTWYRLRVEGFSTKSEAANFAKKVKTKLKVHSAWISKM